MRRALVTGARGTVGSALVACLAHRGVGVVQWSRRSFPPKDHQGTERLITDSCCDVLFHLALAPSAASSIVQSVDSNVEWPVRLASTCASAGVRFVFASTARVFSYQMAGPFYIDTSPDESEGYGHQKRVAETRVLAANRSAVVARLGWQIANTNFGNNMYAALLRQHQATGRIRADMHWLPAASTVWDTAVALTGLANPAHSGVYHLDSNLRWSMYEIATALSAKHSANWRIEPTENRYYDQRLFDNRMSLPPLSEYLPALP